MKLIKIPLAVAAVFSLGIAGIAPALADSQPPAPAHRPHVAKGQSAPGARSSAALSRRTTTSPAHSSYRAPTTP